MAAGNKVNENVESPMSGMPGAIVFAALVKEYCTALQVMRRLFPG